MAGFQERRFQNLMTGGARGGAHIKIAQIAHPGADSGIVGPVFSGVSAQPTAGRAVTVLARDAFVRMRFRPEATPRDRLQRRMTNGATRAAFGWPGAESFGDPL